MLFSMLFLATSLPAAQEPGVVLTDVLTEEVRDGLCERRVLDPETGRIFALGTLADGTPVAPGPWRTARHQSEVERRHGISTDLQRALAERAPEQAIDVVFWLRRPPGDYAAAIERFRQRGFGLEDARRAAFASAVADCAAGNAGFAARLRAAGHEVLLVADAWPNVFARLPVAAVADWAADPAVDQAYYAFPHWEPELAYAEGTMRTPTVWNRGVHCTSSPVKVLVNDVGDVVSNNPYLPPIVYLSTTVVDAHSTAVAGNIAFDHPDYQAAAAGLPVLYSGAGSSDASAPPVWSAAVQNGVCFGNCSWWNFNSGSIVYLDRFFDYTIRQFGVMMFKSNGNLGQSTQPYATTPGNGYNMISTGADSDRDDTAWAGDFMASYSSYWDPVEGHEKPELATPGDGVDTAGTTGPGWLQQGFSGTSSASPLACGVATLLATREPLMMSHPELVKGVLMVSAWHNIEGSDLLSDRDGAGGIDAAAADALLRDHQFRLPTLDAGSFGGGSYEVSFEAYAGDETRVIALWLSNPNQALSTDFLDMDLDAAVLDPQSRVVAAEANTRNAFELLQFTPSQTGTYVLRLSAARFNGTSEPLCVAWSSRLDTATARVSVLGHPHLNGTLRLLFEDPYEGDLEYQAHLSLRTLPATASIDNSTVLPLGQDALFQASGTWEDFRGELGPLGRADTVIAIPGTPGLLGRTYYAAFYTMHAGVVHSISEATPFIVLP